jgi:hypothetical protein
MQEVSCPLEGCDYTADTREAVEGHISASKDDTHGGESGKDHREAINASATWRAPPASEAPEAPGEDEEPGDEDEPGDEAGGAEEAGGGALGLVLIAALVAVAMFRGGRGL